MAEVVGGTGDGEARFVVAVRLLVARREFGLERLVGLAEQHPVLRAARPGERRLDAGEVEVERVGEHRVGRGRVAPHALRAAIGLDQLDLMRVAARQLEVVERRLIDREEAARRAVFGGHVGDRRAVGERQRVEAGAVELDEAPDDALGAEHLGDGEDEVGGGDALGHRAFELEADDLGDQHADRLAEHRRLGLDPADAPAEDAEAVDHRRVAVGADQRVGVGDDRPVGRLARPHRLGEIFEIDLMADAGARRDDAKALERRRSPAEEFVALDVAAVFEVHVVGERLRRAELVDHDAVVDDEVDRDLRVDLGRVAAELGHRVAHRGEVDDARHAGEVLHQDARRAIGDLAVAAAVGRPLDHRGQVVVGDGDAVLEAEQVFEQYLHRERQAGDVAQRLGGGGEAVVSVVLAIDRQRPAGLQAILSNGGHGRLLGNGSIMRCVVAQTRRLATIDRYRRWSHSATTRIRREKLPMPTTALRRADKQRVRAAKQRSRADLVPFLRAWLAAPLRVAAIAPSGPGLAKAMTAEISAASMPVIEFGPGTGVFTQAILDAGVTPDRLVMVEAGADFAALMRARFPAVRLDRRQCRRTRRNRSVRAGAGGGRRQRPADPVDAEAGRPRDPRQGVRRITSRRRDVPVHLWPSLPGCRRDARRVRPRRQPDRDGDRQRAPGERLQDRTRGRAVMP